MEGNGTKNESQNHETRLPETTGNYFKAKAIKWMLCLNCIHLAMYSLNMLFNIWIFFFQDHKLDIKKTLAERQERQKKEQEFGFLQNSNDSFIALPCFSGSIKHQIIFN